MVITRHTDDDFGLTLLMHYFHQDWRHDGSELDVLGVALPPDQDPRAVLALRQDAALVANGLSDNEIRVIWLAGTDGPEPAETGPLGRAWMNAIVEYCDGWLARARYQPPPTELEELGGSRSEDVVVHEIQEVSARLGRHPPPWALGSWDLVGEALTSCARRCTPDLALRLLLRVICRNGIRIPRSQYELLVVIGQSFGYGDFLVTRAEPFVDEGRARIGP